MEIILSLLCVLLRVLDFIFTPIFKYRAKNKRQFLPPLKSDLLRISATEAADKIRKKILSSEELCQVYIDRIKEVNGILNAVVEERFSQALKEAKQVDDYLQKTSLGTAELEKIKPLLGVPVTVKESCSVQGMSLAVGLKSRIGFKAENDSEAVARIKSCGAIVLLVSSTPELCLSWETYSQLNGYANNPYDSTCTAGGSSGGEAALIGSGASLIGVSSDIAGSIRLPAFFTGIFGHKPTPKIIPIKGHWPIGHHYKYSEFLVVGPLAKYATDLKLMMNVMCGNKLSSELNLNKKVDLSKLRVFFMEDMGFAFSLPRVNEDIKGAVRESVKHLTKECNATVEEFKFEDFKRATEICASELYTIEDIPNAMKWERTGFFIEFIKTLFGRSKFTLNLMYFYFLERLYKYVVSNYATENENLKKVVKDKLGSDCVILLPTYIGPAHKHNQMFLKNGYLYLVLANALGLPATTVPCGFDKNGMPIGVQVMAGSYQDRLCLAVAEELERFFGGWIPPPETN